MTNATTTTPLINQVLYDVNQHWMIYAGSLVFLMQAGFSLLEAGSAGAKNATNILFKNVLVSCTITRLICTNHILRSQHWHASTHCVIFFNHSGRMH